MPRFLRPAKGYLLAQEIYEPNQDEAFVPPIPSPMPTPRPIPGMPTPRRGPAPVPMPAPQPSLWDIIQNAWSWQPVPQGPTLLPQPSQLRDIIQNAWSGRGEKPIPTAPSLLEQPKSEIPQAPSIPQPPITPPGEPEIPEPKKAGERWGDFVAVIVSPTAQEIYDAQFPGRPPAKARLEWQYKPERGYALPEGLQKEYVDKTGIVHTWDPKRGQYVVTGYKEPPEKPPTTFPLPEGQAKTYTDAQGYTWTWDERKGDYNQTGYQKPRETEAEEAERLIQAQIRQENARRQVWAEINRIAERSWVASREAAEAETGRRKEEVTEQEKAYQRGITGPFSLLLASLLQGRTPTTTPWAFLSQAPAGRAEEYLAALEAIRAGKIPQLGGLGGLPGGAINIINAMRAAGLPVAGTEASWINRPLPGGEQVRVFGGSPEYQELLQQGRKPFLPSLPETMVEEATPGRRPYQSPEAAWAAAEEVSQQRAIGVHGGAWGRMLVERQKGEEAEARQLAMPSWVAAIRGRRRF